MKKIDVDDKMLPRPSNTTAVSFFLLFPSLLAFSIPRHHRREHDDFTEGERND